jgi:serine/threonine-protein kinase
MQDDIVRQVAALIGASMPKELAQALTVGGTAVPAAYARFVEARGFLQRYLKIESLNKAIAAFQQAIEADPKYALAHAGLGEAYWRKYQLTKIATFAADARASCATALALADRLPAAHLTLGLIDVGTNKISEAVDELNKVIALDPLNADAYRELGNAYGTAKPAEAEEAYKKAIQMRPSVWANYNDLARFYLNLRKYDDAKAQYQHVIDLTPDSAQAYSNMGAAYISAKDYDLAERTLRKSVDIEPLASAFTNLGAMYFSQRRYAEAARMNRQAADIGERDGDRRSLIWSNLASALYWAPGERDNARPIYAKALALIEEELQIRPGDAPLLIRKADCQSRLSQAAAARESITQALAAAPPNAGQMAKIAGIYEQLGDRAQALIWIRKALDAKYSRDNVEQSPDLAQLRADPKFPKK